MAQSGSSSITDLEQRLSALEAEGAIRRVVARYMEICDALGPDTPMDELGDLFTEDAVWEGSGEKYGKAFGGHKGREAIVAFLDTYRKPKPHFASNVHFLTSEALTVNGTQAVGTWVMLQTPSFNTGESFVLAARLRLKFKYEHGYWRIDRFRTTNLFGRPIKGGWHSSAPIPVPQNPQSKEQ
ncbi:nuclear transport factor 2 family protein [Kordiimonas pumila]|uniref:Nuclear transport factor 2 family protein n=1 Tax=Kordiimonas pumila TaxID=2161677 RepID=A0ABV7D5J8_9PROT|nr:nuclear transport factor 2 family protein [Kordiimonas pumila]